MPITVNQRPSTLISGNTSRWNAAKNPVVYKFVRKDYNITAVANSGGALQITVNANLATLTSAQGGPVVTGSVLYVNTDNGVYNGFYTVVTCTNAANSVVTFGASTYTAAATTGYINLNQRTNYYIAVDVCNGVSNAVITSMRYAPARDGNILADVAGPLINSIGVDNVFDYSLSTVTSDETTAYINFYVKYTEVWTGSSNAQTDDVANKFYALYGARQIGDGYGGNLAEYVAFENGTPKAKFLTAFSRATLWMGYPFSLSIITSDNVTSTSNFIMTYFDSAGGAISSSTATKAANGGKLLRFMPVKQLAIPSNAVYMTVRWERTGPLDLTDPFFIDIKDPCSNPIMLWWRNSLGGDAWWMFEVNQEYGFRYDNGRKARRYKLFADNLTLNQFDAIQELVTLGEVYEPAYTELTTSVNKSQVRIGSQVYMVDANGKKTGVIVIPNEFITLTYKKRHKIQITIELPEIY
jgi:hypothetical protein